MSKKTSIQKGKRTVVVVEFLNTDHLEEESECKKIFIIKGYEIGEQLEMFKSKESDKKS